MKYDTKTVNRAKDLLDALRRELPPHSTSLALSILADSEVDEDCSLLIEHIETISEDMAAVMLEALQARRCAAEMARTLARVDELERWWIARLPRKRLDEAMDDFDRVVAYVSKSGDGEGCEELLMNWFWLAAGHR